MPVVLVDWTLEMQVIHLTTVLESLDNESWYLKNCNNSWMGTKKDEGRTLFIRWGSNYFSYSYFSYIILFV